MAVIKVADRHSWRALWSGWAWCLKSIFLTHCLFFILSSFFLFHSRVQKNTRTWQTNSTQTPWVHIQHNTHTHATAVFSDLCIKRRGSANRKHLRTQHRSTSSSYTSSFLIWLLVLFLHRIHRVVDITTTTAAAGLFLIVAVVGNGRRERRSDDFRPLAKPNLKKIKNRTKTKKLVRKMMNAQKQEQASPSSSYHHHHHAPPAHLLPR